MSWLHKVSSVDRRWRLAPSKLNSLAADVEMKTEIIITKTISNSFSISGDWSQRAPRRDVALSHGVSSDF